MISQQIQQQAPVQTKKFPYMLWLSTNGLTWMTMIVVVLPYSFKLSYNWFHTTLTAYITIALIFLAGTTVAFRVLWKKNQRRGIIRLFYALCIVGLFMSLSLIYPILIMNYTEYSQDPVADDLFRLFAPLAIFLFLGFRALSRIEHPKPDYKAQ